MQTIDELMLETTKAIGAHYDMYSIHTTNFRTPITTMLAIRDLTTAVENLTHVVAGMAQTQRQALDLLLSDRDLKP